MAARYYSLNGDDYEPLLGSPPKYSQQQQQQQQGSRDFYFTDNDYERQQQLFQYTHPEQLSTGANGSASGGQQQYRSLEYMLGMPSSEGYGHGGNDGNQDGHLKRTERNPLSRLTSVDVCRGGTLAVMIMVNNTPVASHPEWWGHANWNGLHLADLVMPAFLFLVGVSIALSFEQLLAKGTSKTSMFWKVLVRSIKLFVLGLFCQGLRNQDGLPWPFVDLAVIRVMGVLQRIAVVYFCTATAYLVCPPIQVADWANGGIRRFFMVSVKYLFLWLIGLAFAAAYLLIGFLVYVPDHDFAIGSYACSTSGDFSPACNAFFYVDTLLLGQAHMYIPSPIPIEPEGLSTSLMAMGSAFAGVYFGLILFHFRDERLRLGQWTVTALLLSGAGTLIHFFTPLEFNKKLYTPSYMLVNAGITGGCLLIVYILVDSAFAHRRLKFVRYITYPFACLGVNSIILYVGSMTFLKFVSMVYFEEQSQNLPSEFHQWVASPWANTDKAYIGEYMWALILLLFWTLVAVVLHRLKIFIKV